MWVLAALALAGLALALWLAWPRGMRWVRAAATGKDYYVKALPGAQAAADRLAALELRVHAFLRNAADRAPGDPRLLNIARRWNGTLMETPVDAHVAYSVSKDAVALCVRAADGSLEPENTSMFVLLHELAHVATDAYGHPPEFWANMRFLLELAEATGSYAYQDFDAAAGSYCGRALQSSPLTCVKRERCASELARDPGS